MVANGGLLVLTRHILNLGDYSLKPLCRLESLSSSSHELLFCLLIGHFLKLNFTRYKSGALGAPNEIVAWL
jgi:hypothetical protein